MKTMTRALGASLVALCLAVGTAAAGAPEQGAGMLTAKDLAARTVTIDGHVYHVTEATRISDLNGLPLTLAEVRVQDPWGGEYVYRFDAVPRGGRLELVTLRLEDAPR